MFNNIRPKLDLLPVQIEQFNALVRTYDSYFERQQRIDGNAQTSDSYKAERHKQNRAEHQQQGEFLLKAIWGDIETRTDNRRQLSADGLIWQLLADAERALVQARNDAEQINIDSARWAIAENRAKRIMQTHQFETPEALFTRYQTAGQDVKLYIQEHAETLLPIGDSVTRDPLRTVRQRIINDREQRNNTPAVQAATDRFEGLKASIVAPARGYLTITKWFINTPFMAHSWYVGEFLSGIHTDMELLTPDGTQARFAVQRMAWGNGLVQLINTNLNITNSVDYSVVENPVVSVEIATTDDDVDVDDLEARILDLERKLGLA